MKSLTDLDNRPDGGRRGTRDGLVDRFEPEERSSDPAAISRSGGAAVNEPDGWRITRQHVEELLPVMRLSPAQERRLLALQYPVDFSVAAAAFESVGVDLDVLIDRMGGSP
jgi:hypothetical protein